MGPAELRDRAPRTADDPNDRERVEAFAAAPVLALSFVIVAVLSTLSMRYGYHRDELYYIWGGEHPTAGYVDHPPLVPLLARATDVLGGHTLFAIRLVPALIAGWLAVAGALVARELGGQRTAQTLATFAVICLPATSAPEVLFGTTAFDAAVWAGLLVLVARLLRTHDTRLWIPIGTVIGIGLETKWTVLVLVAGLGLGLLAGSERRLLRSPFALAGAAIAAVLWLPNLAWNRANGWPALEFQRSVASTFGALDKRLVFLPMVLLLGGIVAIAVWGPGLWWLLRHPDGRRFRALGIAAIATTIIVLLEGGKPYYLAPMFIPLLAAGAVVLERASTRRRRTAVWLLAGLAIVALPLTVPVLPAEGLNAIHAVNPTLEDMVGWPELVDQTRAAWATLPADERAHAVIVTANYGEAGVLLRDATELPVYSAHNSLWFQGPPPASATTLVTVGYRQSRLAPYCTSVSQIGTITNAAGVHNEEFGQPILVCRGLVQPWPELWPKLKHFQ